MKRIFAAPSLLLGALLSGTLLAGCNQTVYPDRPPTFIHNVAADSIVFWPPSLKYAREGDTVSFLLIGLQRGYVCAKVSLLGWNWNDEDSASDIYRLNSVIQVPGNPTCALDTKGLDSLFKRVFSTPSGQKLYLQTSAGVSTDSLLYVAGNGYTDVFQHLVSGPDSAAFGGRFLFHDSTLARPRRFVTADSMASCETFQSAAFKRNGDTLTVRVKRLAAVPLAINLFPPCGGPHADTVDVVFDRYRYP
jgi:hypothetical protein